MGWVCANQMNDTDPFGSGVGIISLGILFLAVLCVPVGFWNLVPCPSDSGSLSDML